MIATSELASMRAAAVERLPDTCSILRSTLTSDGVGGFVEAWATLATVPCRVAPTGRAPEERAVADRHQAVATYTVTLPAETDVSARDVIAWGSRRLEVLGVLTASGEVTRRCVTGEVQP